MVGKLKSHKPCGVAKKIFLIIIIIIIAVSVYYMLGTILSLTYIKLTHSPQKPYEVDILYIDEEMRMSN